MSLCLARLVRGRYRRRQRGKFTIQNLASYSDEAVKNISNFGEFSG